MSLSFRSAARFAPKLESLEAREVPAGIQVLVNNNVLQIIGDNHANAIAIHDNGQGKISVEFGNESFTVSGIATVKIDANGGNDTVHYKLTGPLKTTETIVAKLGSGADQGDFNFLAGVASNGHLTLKVNDGAGDDKDVVKLGTIASGGSATIAINGGSGANTVDLHTPDAEYGKLIVKLKNV